MIAPAKTLHKPGAMRGVAVVEMVMVLPILLVLMFGVIDIGRSILSHQVLINLSREAANLTSRGTSLDDAIAAIQVSAAPLDIERDGYIVITEVLRDANGRLSIVQQRTAGGEAHASHIGTGIGNTAVLPATSTAIPPNGRNLFAAEVFYRSKPITPLGNLIDIETGGVYYDVAFF